MHRKNLGRLIQIKLNERLKNRPVMKEQTVAKNKLGDIKSELSLMDRGV